MREFPAHVGKTCWEKVNFYVVAYQDSPFKNQNRAKSILEENFQILSPNDLSEHSLHFSKKEE